MRRLSMILVSVLLMAPGLLPAQQHVVSPNDLRSEVRAAGASRERNAETVRTFLNSEMAREAVGKAGLTSGKIDKAVAALSDAELASLAARSEKIQSDFAAGLTNTQVTYIILGTILIIVVAILAG